MITGGTDGMGRALATACLRRSDRVVVIGTDSTKGQAILDAAAEWDAADRVEFLRADLSVVAENRRAIDRIATAYPTVDQLVLAARYFRATRQVTADGFEANFALFYLSRYLFGHGLTANLERAGEPVILNLAGPGGALSKIQWDDLQFAHEYDPHQVMRQCGKLNDLLAVAFTRQNPGSPIRYLLLHPGLTATGFTGQYDAASAALLADMRKRGQPVQAALTRIQRHLDNPSPEPLAAYMQDTPIAVHGKPFDHDAADRLAQLTATLLKPLTSNL